MPDPTSNIEFAHKIHEHGQHGGGSDPHRQEWLEILEAVVLAAVAVLTAWSGYQAARWDAKSVQAYALAGSTNVKAQEQHTLSGQDRLYDIITFDSWIEARHRGEEKVAALCERRFRPEYTVAFAAWLKTDPFRNSEAPPGPSFMPEYRSAKAETARALAEEARGYLRAGVANRQTGDEYVRITVILATVLLLTALAQRFKIRRVRVGLLALASAMLVFAMYIVAAFPRA